MPNFCKRPARLHGCPYLCSLSLQLVSQLANCGRLSTAIDSHNQNHTWAGGAKAEGCRTLWRGEDFDDGCAQCLPHFILCFDCPPFNAISDCVNNLQRSARAKISCLQREHKLSEVDSWLHCSSDGHCMTYSSSGLADRSWHSTQRRCRGCKERFQSISLTARAAVSCSLLLYIDNSARLGHLPIQRKARNCATDKLGLGHISVLWSFIGASVLQMWQQSTAQLASDWLSAVYDCKYVQARAREKRKGGGGGGRGGAQSEPPRALQGCPLRFPVSSMQIVRQQPASASRVVAKAH